MRPMVKAFIADDRAATAIEYALIAALIAVLALVGVATAGSSIQGLFNRTSTKATAVWDNAGL